MVEPVFQACKAASPPFIGFQTAATPASACLKRLSLFVPLTLSRLMAVMTGIQMLEDFNKAAQRSSAIERIRD